MARFIVQNRIKDPADLSAFNLEGYKFSKKDSTSSQPVFLRKH